MSFIEYEAESHFPLKNIPFGVFSTAGSSKRVGTRIGDVVIDLHELAKLGLLELPNASDIFGKVGLASWPRSGFDTKDCLNAFMALPSNVVKQTREQIQKLFAASSKHKELLEKSKVMVDAKDVTMHLPAQIGDYTDFYASKEHATNVGVMFRGKENALMPNWVHLPVGYHGRASSIVVGGTNIVRPHGQRNTKPPTETPVPVFGPSVRLDYELEMAFFIGQGNELGEPIPISKTSEHIFGVALLNDWSARDIQAWEYVPLGPFLGKNFATSISPWVVTMHALEPFRVKSVEQVPKPLEYLCEIRDDCALDVNLQVSIKRTAFRKSETFYLIFEAHESQEWSVLTTTNLKYMYWSIGQQVAHHTVNGCNMRTGDVLGTGTISGPTPDSYGSLLELCWTGTKPLTLGRTSARVFVMFVGEKGVKRTFLEDGDELKMTGYAQGNGYRVGFGECTGVILPAKKQQ